MSSGQIDSLPKLTRGFTKSKSGRYKFQRRKEARLLFQNMPADKSEHVDDSSKAERQEKLHPYRTPPRRQPGSSHSQSGSGSRHRAETVPSLRVTTPLAQLFQPAPSLSDQKTDPPSPEISKEISSVSLEGAPADDMKRNQRIKKPKMRHQASLPAQFADPLQVPEAQEMDTNNKKAPPAVTRL